MRLEIPRARTLALCYAALLTILLVLASSSSVPAVDISQLGGLDEGTSVRLVGVTVAMSPNAGGSEDLVMADLADGSTVKVICMPGARPMPSRYVSIGDEVSVTCSTGGEGSGVVFAGSDGVEVIRESVSALSVESLASNWILFEGDSFGVGGLLRESTLGGFVLSDPDLAHSISIVWPDGELSRFLGKRVVAQARLLIYGSTMVLYLSASSVQAGFAQ